MRTAVWILLSIAVIAGFGQTSGATGVPPMPFDHAEEDDDVPETLLAWVQFCLSLEMGCVDPAPAHAALGTVVHAGLTARDAVEAQVWSCLGGFDLALDPLQFVGDDLAAVCEATWAQIPPL